MTEADLLRMLDQGDRDAQVAFVKLSRPVFVSAIRRITRAGFWQGMQADESDLLQHLYAALFKDGGRVLRGWRQDGGLQLQSYLWRFAWNQLRTLARQLRTQACRQVPDGDAVLAQLPDARTAPATSLSEADLACLSHLRQVCAPADLRFLTLYFVEGWTAEEVCREFPGLSQNAFYQRISRLRRELREIRDQAGPRSST